MSYQALYRKFRPTTFEEVVGQEHITITLANQIKQGQISHAYLFTGTRGTGKTSIAKIFAKAINCIDNKNGSPCGKCEVCKNLANPSNMDILEIDAASNNRVDEIRDLRENVKFLPTVGKYKVFIIDEVHMLTDSAFNALLKTLEEPPEHVVFILATTEPHKLPQTIISRCMRFDFALISVETLVKLLKNILDKEHISYNDDALQAIAVAGEGSCRDTLSIADCVVAYASGEKITLEFVKKVLGTTDKQNIIELVNSISEKDIGKGLEIIDNVCKSGKNIGVFAKDVTCHFRDLLVIKSCKEPNKILLMAEDIFEKCKEQSNKIENIKLIECMQIFSAIEAELKYAINPRTLVEMALLTCISGENELKKN